MKGYFYLPKLKGEAQFNHKGKGILAAKMLITTLINIILGDCF